MVAPILRDPFKSNLERAYAQRLDLLKRAGEIIDWRYEAMRFRVGGKVNLRDAFYTPDFLVITGERVELHETKGRWMEAARVRIAAAASLFPWFAFKAVYRKKKEWTIEDVTP